MDDARIIPPPRPPILFPNQVAENNKRKIAVLIAIVIILSVGSFLISVPFIGDSVTWSQCEFNLKEITNITPAQLTENLTKWGYQPKLTSTKGDTIHYTFHPFSSSYGSMNEVKTKAFIKSGDIDVTETAKDAGTWNLDVWVKSNQFRGTKWDEQMILIQDVFTDVGTNIYNLSLRGGGGSSVGCGVVHTGPFYIQPNLVGPIADSRP